MPPRRQTTGQTRRRPPTQLRLAARGGGRGGYRHGAGRRPKKPEERRGHGPRPLLDPRHPVHVTLRVRADVPNLRRGRIYAVLRTAFTRGKDRFGFRLAHFSVQGNHVHLVCEADDRTALSRGMQGLAVRIARGLNRKIGRRGKVLAERYHLRVLRSPTEVRRVLVYVYGNARRHAGGALDAVDPWRTSAPWFTGWRYPLRDMRLLPRGEPPVATPRAWLLAEGWKRRGGLLSAAELPAGAGPT